MYEMQIVDNAGKCDYCNGVRAFRFTKRIDYRAGGFHEDYYFTCELCSALFTSDENDAIANLMIKARLASADIAREFELSRRAVVDSLVLLDSGVGAFCWNLRQIFEAHGLPSVLQT